jgi:ketosteroid isomerase-like protein
MKKIILSMAITAIFGIVNMGYAKAVSPAGPDKDSVKAAIAGVNKIYGEAYLKGDSSLFLDCYTPDGCIMAANTPILGKRSGQLLFYKAAYKTGIRNIIFTTVELYGLTDEYVTEQGVYELFGSNGQSLGKGKYLVLWKKTAAGWKMHRDMFNGDAPMK